jgi:hypothetical protein
MRGTIESIVAPRGVLSRFACLPAVPIFVFMVVASVNRQSAIEAWLMLAVCFVQALRPTLLGWAVVVSWLALAAVETISLSLRPGYFGAGALLPLALVLLPVVLLLVFRPRIQVGERVALACALLIGLAVTSPFFTVWSR